MATINKVNEDGGHPRLVALGGGTGLATLLRGVKQLPFAAISAVVTVTDDGGSSGRLRREYGIPPPGDVRNCLVALAEDDELLTRLFAFRFPGSGPTGGHTLGNLFMAALHQLTGDFPQAVRLAGEVLRIRGQVLPATEANVHLVAEGRDGTQVVGETAISAAGPPRRVFLSPPQPAAPPQVLHALESADLVVIGPGSLYTSVIPNLLVPEVLEALRQSSALKVFVANLVTQPGETTGFSLRQHVEELLKQTGGFPLDVVLANGTPLPEPVAARYGQAGAAPVLPEEPGVGRLVVRDLLAVTPEGTVRHHPLRLAQALWGIWEETP